ncbi:energy-coupling factor ABC transporter permease [Ferrimonas marina]|uniref:Uncharacterized membrane protein n=1 Tax=Ferrimonas marina TaxID=299255 RepID=A0A1M5SHK1_9GAMM|nr:energy-coupling factor ABC transporter permease [Ferrimonas marina]SHH37373.1 Uncharacterized membrane protein [Ferrimonas marina]
MGTELNLIAVVLFALLLGWAGRDSALWHNWRTSRYFHLTMLVAVATLCLWRIRAGIYEGLDLHFLAITLVTLMFGWRTALLVLSAAQTGLLLAGVDLWQHAGALFWLGIALPVGFSYLWLSLCHNLLPKNLWVYVFVGAFLNGALTFVIRTLGLALYYQGSYDWSLVMDNYVVLIPLFMFPEAMLNGFPTTMLVVYKPDWLATWDERRYMQDKD